MTLRLRTFGAVFLERDRAPLGGAHTQRRRLALLAYLAAADRSLVTRDRLIALLWPESDEAAGRHALSQLLYAIRRDLDPNAIVAEKETVGLNHDVLASDVHAFDVAMREGRLSDAVKELRGPFLEGFHLDSAPELSRWIEEERSRRAGIACRTLERLAEEAERAGDRRTSVERWQQRVALSPTDSRATLRLMRALAAVEDRTAAVQTARIYAALVRDELEVEPDAAVMSLAEQLRHAPGIAHGDVQDLAPPPARPQLAEAPHVVQSRRRRAAPIAAGAVALVLALVALQLRSRDDPAGSPAAPTAGATRVVLGNLAGPDTLLALAVREALRAELTNAGGVILTSELGLRQASELMRLEHDSALFPPHLLDLAARSGAHVAIAGSVVPIGGGAQILIELLDPATGRTVASLPERSADDVSLLAAVERLGRALRSAISRTPFDTTVRALPAVTTASLPALKSYALAREAASLGMRVQAIEDGERAVVHDTTFALAHYLVGDLLWFIDQQGHAEAHLTRAHELHETVPRPERLAIQARYQQLVLDEPDSALVYWHLLRDAAPNDPLAYEGRAWALRALGRHEEAAAAADTAMRLDPAALVPNTNNAMYSWLAVGDTAGALALAERIADRHPGALREARFFAALFRGDATAALGLANAEPGLSGRANRQQLAYLSQRDVDRGRLAVDSLRVEDAAQFVPRALLNQGWAEHVLRGDRQAARRYAREALEWLRSRDLSPPAVARLSERIGVLAGRAGDVAMVRETAALVRQRDRGRNLRSYVLALRTLDAALAFAGGEFAQAARLAAAARRGVYFSRSLVTIVKLEADARRAIGELAAADSLDALVASHRIVDGDFETWALLRAIGLRTPRHARR
jgi:DNA-binding SARP family transcriptional activator